MSGRCSKGLCESDGQCRPSGSHPFLGCFFLDKPGPWWFISDRVKHHGAATRSRTPSENIPQAQGHPKNLCTCGPLRRTKRGGSWRYPFFFCQPNIQSPLSSFPSVKSPSFSSNLCVLFSQMSGGHSFSRSTRLSITSNDTPNVLPILVEIAERTA